MKHIRKLLCFSLAAVILCLSVSCASKVHEVGSVINGTVKPGVAPGPDGKYPGEEDETVELNSPVYKNPASNNGLGENGGTNSVNGNTPSTDDVISKIDGWWKHVGGTDVEDQIFVEIMYVDAENGTWTEYSRNGVKGDTYKIELGEYGLYFEYGDIGRTILNFDGISLLNMNGTIEFIPGEPVTEIIPNAYDGTWYLNGDTSAESLVISGVRINAAGVDGTYTAEDKDITLYDGTKGSYPAIKTDSGRVLFVAETGDALYDSEKRQVYIRDRKVGTPEGDDFVKKYDLICHDWAFSGEETTILTFDYFEKKMIVTREGGKTEVIGTWGIHEYELSLHYSDGHEEITPYDPESLMFSYYNHLELVKIGTDKSVANTSDTSISG